MLFITIAVVSHSILMRNNIAKNVAFLSLFLSLLFVMLNDPIFLPPMFVQVFKSLVRGQQPLDDVGIPNSVYLHTYIIYLRQTYTVERNLLMIEALRSSKQGDSKKNRPQDFARLYEIIVQVSSNI